MKRIQTDLLLFGPIEKAARRVYGQALTELVTDDINRTAAAGHPYELAGPSQFVHITAAGAILGTEKTLQLPGPVEIVEIDRSSRMSPRRWQCEKATITVEGEGWTPILSLDLFNARSADVGGTLMMRYTVTGLAIPPSIAAKATAPPLLETLTSPGLAAALSTGPSPQFTQALDNLRRQIRDTLSQITAEVHSRLVFGIGCIPMILIGIVLGILKRGGHLLNAFAISCLPAIILIVGIVGGKQLTTNPGSQGLSGPILMWTGLAVLWILAFKLYHRLQSQ
jgi:hypothetical protein